MAESTVGAGIVSIITESLYDKPIVVFREYVQNAVDALDKAKSIDSKVEGSVQIWSDSRNLFFLDNGTGIQPDNFYRVMMSIAHSGKRKTENLGYKGIGRLSGISYCRNLSFINIIDYTNHIFQEFTIDGDKYSEIRKSESYNDMDFDSLMVQIGSLLEHPDVDGILRIVEEKKELFMHRDTGFLVVLKDISSVLTGVIEDSQFANNLGWLLPAPFLPEMITAGDVNGLNYELFASLSEPIRPGESAAIPAKSFKISYNGNDIHRPLTNNMLRTYLCRSNLDQYAVCVHTFSNKKIDLDRKNPFSGIRIYIDNVLLCDENELIPALRQYGFIKQGSTYEVLQTVRGIGAMIFIVDKVNISANARRTFIDVTDDEAFNFLALIGEFIDSIFAARYALSNYNSAKRKEENDQERLDSFKERALCALEVLARSDITLEVEDKPEPTDFQSMSKTEQKRVVKSIIVKEFSSYIKKYLLQTEEYNPETCFRDFKTWLGAN